MEIDKMGFSEYCMMIFASVIAAGSVIFLSEIVAPIINDNLIMPFIEHNFGDFEFLMVNSQTISTITLMAIAFILTRRFTYNFGPWFAIFYIIMVEQIAVENAVKECIQVLGTWTVINILWYFIDKDQSQIAGKTKLDTKVKVRMAIFISLLGVIILGIILFYQFHDNWDLLMELDQSSLENCAKLIIPLIVAIGVSRYEDLEYNFFVSGFFPALITCGFFIAGNIYNGYNLDDVYSYILASAGVVAIIACFLMAVMFPKHNMWVDIVDTF